MNEWLNEWMNEWMNERMKEWKNERMNEWMNEWKKETAFPFLEVAFPSNLHFYYVCQKIKAQNEKRNKHCSNTSVK